MFKSLYGKLTIAFVLVAFTTAALVALFIRLTSADRLMEFVISQQRSSLQAALSDYYAENGSWSGVVQNWGLIQVQALPKFEPAPGERPPNDNDGPPGFRIRENMFGLADEHGVVLIPVDPNYPAGTPLPGIVLRAGTAITVDGKQVGTLLIARRPSAFSREEALFLARTTQALIFAMVGALLIALILGLLLARTLTKPLNALTRAAQSITAGQLEQQVVVRSNDEIGQLATAFNRMSQEVARVNQMRRQMTADIAHDLRTPLTVISGYIESMQDGVLKPTPERLAIIYSEIELLEKLVEDLRMLSLAEAGELSLNPQKLSPKYLLDRASALFKHQAEQKSVSLEVESDGELPDIWVDEARMMQVFGNLISNALRYTPPDGRVSLIAQQSDGRVEIRVQDTGEGIEADELPFIFNRFYRSDKSRHAESGETGLGLAIVKALVEAQGGSTSAESKPGEGTTIRLFFPVKS